MTISTKNRILHSAVARIVFGLVICFASLIISQQIFTSLPGVSELNADVRNLIKGIFVSILVLGSYWFFYSRYENRKISELSTKSLGKYLLSGIGIGCGLQVLTVLVIYLFADFEVVAVNPINTLIIPFTVAFTVAILEEVLIRGIIFRIAEENLGSVIAIIISSIIFAGLHLVNPHVTVVSILCIIAVGVLLAAVYMYYRTLWVPIAFHFAWNFTQNGIFGGITSGNEKTSSFLTSKISGPEILTGGAFGPEGSIQAVLVCTVSAAIILWQVYKMHKIVMSYTESQKVNIF